MAVIDAATPEQAEQTAAALAQSVAGDTLHVRSLRRPDASPYFAANGLLFLDARTLGGLMDRTIDAQPLLGQLAADPSARGLLAAFTLLGMSVERGETALAPIAPALAAFRRTLNDAVDGSSRPLSWQTLLDGDGEGDGSERRVVLIQPRLDADALAPGAAATAAIRAAAAALPWVQAGQARVRLTGPVAQADQDTASLARGALVGLIGGLLGIGLALVPALRSWRLILPVLLTLALGLALTSGVAALVVGRLDAVSAGFGILFLGLAADVAIRFCLRFRALHLADTGTAAALSASAASAGPPLLLASAATACGFLAFLPTDFRGGAALGLIGGIGMAVALGCTLAVLPAALALCRPRGETPESGSARGAALEGWLLRARGPVLAGFAALVLLGAALLPSLRFEAAPLPPGDRGADPAGIEILAPDQAQADALAERLRALPLVAAASTLSSLLPADQPEKLAIIADAASILGATLAVRMPAAPVTASDLRLAARTALSGLERAAAKLPPGSELAGLAAALRRLLATPDSTLLAADAALTRFLPERLATLRRALDAHPVGLGDIPPDLAADWRLPDGRARVQVRAKPPAGDWGAMRAFVASVQAVAPAAGGPAVARVARAETMLGACRGAALLALAGIAALLGLALRRGGDVALVLAPLLPAAATVVVVAVLPGPGLDPASAIALPLLPGLAVSFSLPLVMAWRCGGRRFPGTATARASLAAAPASAAAFGALAACSPHPGAGLLLLAGMAGILPATLLLLPALLRTPRGDADGYL